MPMLSERSRAFIALWAMPLFFSTNSVLGRAAVGIVEPWTLACLRWLVATAILWAIAAEGLRRHRAVLLAEWRWILLLGFLGVWVCGGCVYFALRHTTATNTMLIYTTASVLLVLLDWLFRGTRIGRPAIAGILLGLVGVGVIVFQGSLEQLKALNFNGGDLIVGIATVAWSVYSLILKRPALQVLPTLPLFAAIAAAGTAVVAPFALVEIAVTGLFPTSPPAWTAILGLAIFASVAAFSTFQYGLRVLGASIAGLFIYLFPPAGVAMAVIFLGEELHGFHIAGFLLILTALVLATAPLDAWRTSLAAALGRRRTS